LSTFLQKMTLKEEGNAAYKQGKFEEAIQLYTQCLKENPRNHIVLANRGLCFMKLQNYDHAAVDLTMSLKIDNEYLKSWLRRGTVFIELGSLDQALSDFEKALKLDPNNVQAKKEIKRIKSLQEIEQREKESAKKHRKNRKKIKILDANHSMLHEEDQEDIVTHSDQGWYGQLVVGPPGCGKSTYCKIMAEFLKQIGRKAAIVNLDPANDVLQYDATIDVFELISLDDVMEHLKLGPNGGLLYCMEYLDKNQDWLEERLSSLSKDTYILFDFPGQAELFINHGATKSLIKSMVNRWNFQLTCVNMIEIRFCLQPYDFISCVLLSLSTMMHIDLPHVNILSKADMWEQLKEEAHFDLEYYLDLPSLARILERQEKSRFKQRFHKLNIGIVDVISTFNLVNYLPFNINDFATVKSALEAIDRGNGYFFTGKYEIS